MLGVPQAVKLITVAFLGIAVTFADRAVTAQPVAQVQQQRHISPQITEFDRRLGRLRPRNPLTYHSLGKVFVSHLTIRVFGLVLQHLKRRL